MDNPNKSSFILHKIIISWHKIIISWDGTLHGPWLLAAAGSTAPLLRPHAEVPRGGQIGNGLWCSGLESPNGLEPIFGESNL